MIYGYRSEPLCLYEASDVPYGDVSIASMRWQRSIEFEVQLTTSSNPTFGTRSPQLGYALDGFPIFGPFDEHGELPLDLDKCNCRYDSLLGMYVYHTTPGRFPYIVGCFRGSTTGNPGPLSNKFPEFSSQDNSMFSTVL